MPGGHVKLDSLTKQFADVAAVDAISLEIEGGEFFSLLGPSGCGKTTTLRMTAGFEPPTSGRILLDGVDVARLAPHRRNVKHRVSELRPVPVSHRRRERRLRDEI